MAVPYLGVPTSNGLVDVRTVAAMESFRRAFPAHGFSYQVCSLLCYSFNRLYADALNKRATHGFTHFVMLHSDVSPQDVDGVPWCVRMIELMDEYRLGALSAAVMIKDDSGDTSAAIEADGKIDRLTPDRIGDMLTSEEASGLLINTGCLVIDITTQSAERLSFGMNDGITNDGGSFSAWAEPEDWLLSRRMSRAGIRFGTTTAVPTLHCCGNTIWSTANRRTLPQGV